MGMGTLFTDDPGLRKRYIAMQRDVMQLELPIFEEILEKATVFNMTELRIEMSKRVETTKMKLDLLNVLADTFAEKS